jgi:nitroimidazol reductase NimA-like FMN-containing flavoprotein (pyridoxamine 5'-phosphate oxidase superfamily)
MRRSEREITGINEKLAVIAQCKVCRIGLSENGHPYIVPLNFGYTWADNMLTLFFHSAHEGKKIDILQKNRNACFEMDCGHTLREGEKPCAYGFGYSSVIGFGSIEFIHEAEAKTHALNALMRHQTGKDARYSYSEQELNAVAVYKMLVTAFTGRHH